MVYWMFDSTANFFEEFTRVNDFTQVSAASVWTMRWQVKGFLLKLAFIAKLRRNLSRRT
jgi:hypothetical protein